ncbi:MAG TPA: hypothetical protein VFQ77_21535 [Pseudonocardiaceae bacterium]|nr:hypothetical protein [Pseudonocardiaceae bacterium]
MSTYPPANSGAVATQVFPSLAGDAPIVGLTAQQLGLTVSLVSNHVGFDPAGRTVLNTLDSAGVQHWARRKQSSETCTSQVSIIADDSGTRTWFAWLGLAAAVHPFPIDLDEDQRQDPDVFGPALERVRQVWAALAFEAFTEDIWILDPRRIGHSDAVAELSKRLGL